jgi:prephenate dehydrogenase
MALFTKVGIVGVGLVGGSLGLALKKKRLASTVVGTSRHAGSIARARAIKAVDDGSRRLDILAGSDLIVLAAPVQTVLDQMGRIRRLIDDDCIVIDVASTKEAVVTKANKLFARFVGCHPLAGSHQTGVANARADLFFHADCIITPVRSTDKAALAAVVKMWNCIGSRVKKMDPAAHDRALAYMSHLPHAMAFALMSAAPRKYLTLAPQSFRDMTRIASSSPELWDDIFITNKHNLCASIDEFTSQLGRIRLALQRNDTRSLFRALTAAQHKRQRSL